MEEELTADIQDDFRPSSSQQFPNVAFTKASGSLHYMLSKHYKEGGISSDNMEDLIKASVSDNIQLQINLLLELIRYKDLPAAAYWAQYFSIDSRNIPFQLQDYMKQHPTLTRHKRPTDDSTDQHNDEYYCLKVSLDQVYFINDQGGLQNCQQTLCQQGNIIGVDAEWRLSACNSGVERIALLQLASKHAVYLLDMIALTAKVSEEILREFIAAVFSSADTIKLGYGITGDFRVIAHSWPFVAEIVGTPCQVIDLQIFAHSVNVAVNLKSGARKKDKPSSHKSASPTTEDLTTPSQCSSLNEGIVMRTFEKLDSIPDETELPSVPVSGDDIVDGDEDNTTEHSTSTVPRGLGLLVKECFGKPLDKSQQLSDWERRPLKREQVYYAALDAYCLLEVYEHLKEKILRISPDFNVTPFLTSSIAGKAVYKGQKEEKGAKRVKEIYENPPKRTGPPIRPGDIKLVVDTMLQGLGRQLRSCGVDVVVLTNDQHHYDAIKSCQQDSRIILTSGAPFNTLKGMVSEGMCVHVNPGKARDQALEVFEHLNIQVTPSDIFSRCQMCNSNNYVLIEKSKMAEIFESLPDTALNKCPLKLNGSEVREDDEVPTELRTARSSLLNNTNYPMVGLNDGLSIRDGVSVVFNHNGVNLNIKNIPVGVLEHVDIFFCCSTCGKVYWEGKHFERFVRTFHGVFNTVTTT